ncbi:39S ribosomal protein L35, mitochondrial [Galendromus occidentalis]|uniref:Large ribosomal subunit protein bL35m n=1 Tax=Galendromus occidentalis TaxID=34638 RepID=A0AAJ6QNQ7_9ACAR|nr:39S ribosomal protein L35, mitochondrial [Galendromus occidentalis]
MLRSLISTARNSLPCTSVMPWNPNTGGLLSPAPSLLEQVRTVTKFGWRKGGRKTVKAALSRFYRLNCGLWIHTPIGRDRKIWRKTPEQVKELRKHVFSRKRHSEVLDKMMTEKFKKPTYLPDSPYEPYDNFKPPQHVYKTYK